MSSAGGGRGGGLVPETPCAQVAAASTYIVVDDAVVLRENLQPTMLHRHQLHGRPEGMQFVDVGCVPIGRRDNREIREPR